MFAKEFKAAVLATGLMAGVVGTGQAADRALLIGLDTYNDARLSFKIAGASANDVEAMKSVLTEKLGYAARNIKILQDQDATKSAILGAIKSWLAAGSKPGDRALFYFAGHGFFQKDISGDEKDGVDETLVPFDARVTGKAGKPIDGMVSDDDLNAALAVLKGRDVSVIIDAGHSGTLTRAITVEARAKPEARSPQLKLAATRAITVEPRLKAQTSEGLLVDKPIPKGRLVTWSAVSASQRALINTEGKPRGVFTGLYVEGIAEAKADLNKNGTISNAELFSYITKGSNEYCGRHKTACEMGLTPRLEPASAFGREVIKTAAKTVKITGTGKVKLTPDLVSDFLTKGNVKGVKIEQYPPSPVIVGTKDVRFRIVSPHDGYLILLNLSDDGELVQLYPNQFSRKQDRLGRIRAQAPLTVPDDYYGIKFNASAPSTGRILALVSRQKVKLPKGVTTRSIEVIPRKLAVNKYLPELAAALSKPIDTDIANENIEPVDWSVATMKYEIRPKNE